MTHKNSRKSLEEERPHLNKRCRAVMGACDMLGMATDRQIKDYLKLSDMNAVRPRVTELICKGLLQEHDSIKCDVTNKTVRRVKLSLPNKNQLELF